MSETSVKKSKSFSGVLFTFGGLGVLVAILAAACTIPPLSQVIFRTYSNVWPPARAAKVMGLINGGIAFEALKAGLELGIFELLDKQPQSAEEIARAVSGDVRGVTAFLEYLSTLDLLYANRGVYSLGGAAKAHLVKSSPDWLAGFAKLMSGLDKSSSPTEAILRGGVDPKKSHDGMQLKTGANVHPFWETFADSTVEMSSQPAAALADYAIASLGRASLDGVRVLDVACGAGVYGFTIAKRHAGISLVSFDQPNVIPKTRRVAERLGVAAQATFLEGNAFDVALPPRSFDIIIVGHFLHHFDAAACVTIMKRMEGALAPGGIIVIHEFVRDEGAYSPWRTAMPYTFNYMMLLSTEKGRAYTLPELTDICAEAGLRVVGSTTNFPMPSTRILVRRAAE